jgi:hypothetical protein
LTKECDISFGKNELETEAEQVLLKKMRRRMRRLTINMQEEEEATIKAEVLAAVSM